MIIVKECTCRIQSGLIIVKESTCKVIIVLHGLSNPSYPRIDCDSKMYFGNGADADGHTINNLLDPTDPQDADTLAARNAAIATAVAYTPATPGQWAGTPPASLAEALNRLAAVVSNAGVNPIP